MTTSEHPPPPDAWEPELDELERRLERARAMGGPENVARQHQAGIVPRSRRQAYNVRALLDHVVDRGSLFEIARHYGPSLVTALARLDGYPVGVLANDPRQVGGALTAAGPKR